MDPEVISKAFKYLTDAKKAVKSARECFFIDCKNNPIGAHSVSKRAHLLQISDAQNTFLEIKQKFIAGSPQPMYEFSPLGINEASKFWGFCQKHDAIFNQIDTMSASNSITPRIQFLLSMRAAAREWCVRQALYDHYIDNVEIDSYQEFKDFFIEYKKGLGDLRKIRKFFNDNYLRENFGSIAGFCMVLPSSPNIAASTAVTPEWGIDGHQINNILGSQILENETLRPVVGIYLNVLPLNNKEILISLGCKKTQLSRIGDLINLPDYHADSIKIILTNLLLESSENVYFSKAFINSLDEDQAKWILRKFSTSVNPIINTLDREATLLELVKLIAPLNTVQKDYVSLFS